MAIVTRKIRCLWLDLKHSVTVAETPELFSRYCLVSRTSGLDEGAVERDPVDFLVLEFDFPSRHQLRRASEFKRRYPNLPMVAITVQHSEALAAWFFRAKFYDYLVQPLSADEVGHCLAELEEIRRLRAEQQQRPVAAVTIPVPAEAGSAGHPRPQLQPALTLVERHYHERLTVTDAAGKCGIPPFRFGREFKEQFGLDFREYVLRYRIREACRLLENPVASITEVSFSVGFSEPSYFTKMFKKLVGCTPTEALGQPDLDDRIPLLLDSVSRAGPIRAGRFDAAPAAEGES